MLKVFSCNKYRRISILLALFALFAFSTSAFADARLILRAPGDLKIGTDFTVTLYIGSGTTALGTFASRDVSRSNENEWVWDIHTSGVYNYRTTTVTGRGTYAMTKLLIITESMVLNSITYMTEIQTGRVGNGVASNNWDASSVGTVPNQELLQVGGALSTPTGSAVFNVPMFAKPGYGRFQFTKQEDLIAYVKEIEAKCEKAHLFMLGDNIDPATGAPFGKTLQYGYDIPIVIVTNSNIPPGSTFDEAAAIIRGNGKPKFLHQGQIHGNEPSPGEGAMAMLWEMTSSYGEKYLERIDYICIPRFNVEGGRNNARSSVNPSIDMNRDHIRMRAPEVRMVHSAYLAIMPEVTQDGHELGSYSAGTHASSTTRQPGVTNQGITLNHDIESTPSTSMNNPSMAVVNYALNLYAKNLFETLLASKIFIDHYEGGSNGWTANNGIGRAYYGLMGSISFLTETRGQNVGVNMSRRAYSQMSAAKSFLNTLYDNIEETKALVAKARDDVVAQGRVFDENVLVYLNQTASGNTTNFRNTGVEQSGSKYTIYKGAARTIDLVGNEMTPTGSSATNVTKSLALNDASNRNRPRPTAYVVPKGIVKTTAPGTTTITSADGYAINYEYLLNSMKWNHIEFYEIDPGTSADLKQYYRSDSLNTTSGAITAGLRSEDRVVFEEGAYVVPLDQVAGAVAVALFEPDISNANGYNAGVSQTVSGPEGFALVYHDVTNRNYPYYRFEKNNPRDVLKSPVVLPPDPPLPPGFSLPPRIEDALDTLGCNAGFGLLILIFAIPLALKRSRN